MKEIDLVPTEEYRIGDMTIRLPKDAFERYFIMVIKAEGIEARIWWPLMTVIGYQDFVKKNRPKCKFCDKLIYFNLSLCTFHGAYELSKYYVEKPKAIPYIKR